MGTIPREQELDGEAKVDDVGILDEILFAFEPKFAGFLAFCFAAVNDEILVGGHFSANKAALDVAMYFAGGFFGNGALGDRPGAHFVFASGKKTDQIEQGVRGADKALARWLINADLFQKPYAVVFIELGDFHFHLPSESEPLEAAPIQLLLVSRIERLAGLFFGLIENHQ